MLRGARFSCFLFLPALASVIVWIGEDAARGDSLPPAPRVVVKNQGYLPFADAPINYRSMELRDPVAQLEKRIERGEVILKYDPQHGYLNSILDAMHVPVSSQALVFSKT